MTWMTGLRGKLKIFLSSFSFIAQPCISSFQRAVPLNMQLTDASAVDKLQPDWSEVRWSISVALAPWAQLWPSRSGRCHAIPKQLIRPFDSVAPRVPGHHPCGQRRGLRDCSAQVGLCSWPYNPRVPTPHSFGTPHRSISCFRGNTQLCSCGRTTLWGCNLSATASRVTPTPPEPSKDVLCVGRAIAYQPLWRRWRKSVGSPLPCHKRGSLCLQSSHRSLYFCFVHFPT